MAYGVSVADPLLLSLNLSTVGQHLLRLPPDRLGFLASAATLVVAAAVLAAGRAGRRLVPIPGGRSTRWTR
jgi:MFS transporter, DHA2 family, multidrug resistance protein